MTRALPRLGAVLLATLALTLGSPVTAHAGPSAIDPACEEFAVGGIVTVDDPEERRDSLPAYVTVDDMSCILLVSTGAGTGVEIYAYLTDPFQVFLDKAARFVADGWSATEALDDGTEIPVDVAALAGRGTEGEINLVFRRGLSGAGLYYATDSIEATFGLGTFLALFTPDEAGGTDVDDPSTISDLRPITEAISTPTQGGVLLISAALLTLLLAIPSFLLSRVLAARYGQWFGWLERGRLGRLREELAKPRSTRLRWIVLGVGMLLAALIASFIDPRFGFNGLSVRLYLTLLLTFVIFNVGAWGVVTLVLRRLQPDAKPVLGFHPASLLVVAVAVLLSRLLQFDPGVVFGLVAGTTFAVTLALSREAIVIIAGTAYAAAVAVVGWVGYSVLAALNPLDAFSVGLTEFLGGLTLEGVATIPIALIPLATLDGGILFRWRRWVWAAVYAGGMALFLLVLFDLPGGDIPVDAGFWNWLLLFGAFAIVAVGVWAVDLAISRQKPRDTAKTTADTTA